MAKDSGNTKLWIGNGLRISEIKTVLNESTGDLGTLCKSSNINAWARYKPFRNSSKGFEPTSAGASAWASAMIAAGFGFGSSLNNLNFSATQSSPSWQVGCLLPRGVTSYNEPYRQLDFADLNSKGDNGTTYGYDKTVGPPMSIDFPSEISQGGEYLTINFDSNVSGWNAHTGISISEVLDNAPAHSSWGQYNLAVRFKNSNNYVNLLVTEYKPTQFATSLHPSVYFTGSTTSGNLYTMVPMFSETNTEPDRVYEGDNVEITVCLVANREAQSYPYVIGYTDVAYSLGSLNLRNNMDSKTLTFHEINSIVGSTGSISASFGTVSTSGNEKTLPIYGISTSITPGPNWGTRTSVNCQFKISVSNASWYLSNTNSSGSGDMEPDSSYPYWGENPTIVNKDSQNNLYTTTQSGTTNNVLAGTAYSSSSDQHKIRRPYIHLLGSSGTTCTITISGFIYSRPGAPDNPPEKIDLTSYTYQVTL